MNFAAAAAESTVLNLDVPLWHWTVLIVWFAALLGIDLLLHRKSHATKPKEAIVQSIIWIALGVGLGFVFWAVYGAAAGGQYFTGYIIEKSLSIDNVFAWSVILTYFRIPKKYQHRVLFWGIFGALVMRALFIFLGVSAINRFEPTLLIFGLILAFSGYRLFKNNEDQEFDPVNSKTLKFFERILPYSHHLEGEHFFTRQNGKRAVTVLFMALVAVELTDVIFAIDSVPAILAISREPIIVFASNAAAILGIRALYFVFDHIKERFWLLNRGLGLLLVGVGIKMILSPEKVFGIDWFNIHISTTVSLVFISVFLIGTMLVSWFVPQPAKQNS